MRAHLSLFLGGSLLALSASASADRLINTPVATKIPARSVRLEFMQGLNNRAVVRESLLYAVDETFEIEARRFRSQGREDTTFDVYATIISPFKGYAPGIAVGVRDILGETNDGRRGWVAVTFREAFQVGELERGADITIGGFIGTRGSALLALSIPLGPDLRFLAENDGIRLTAGVQYSPIRNLDLRIYAEDQTTLGSFRYSLRF